MMTERKGVKPAIFSVLLIASTAGASPVLARMLGGSRCKMTEQNTESGSAIFTYKLDCGNETAKVMETENPFNPSMPRVVMAMVKQADGNVYSAGNGAEGRAISAPKGNHLSQGDEGEGQGRVAVLDEIWNCQRIPTYTHPETERLTSAESKCELSQ